MKTDNIYHQLSYYGQHLKVGSDCSVLADGWYPDPYSCLKYWRCEEGAGTHYICPEDQIYIADRVQCDYSDHGMECGNRPNCNDCDDDCP